MIKPILFLQETQIAELFKQNFKNGDFLKAIAFSFDENSVFHVYTKNVPQKTSSKQYVCYIQFVSTQDIQSTNSLVISNLIKQLLIKNSKESFLIISLAIDNNKLLNKASFVDDEKITFCETKFIPKNNDLYSRAKGLIETDILKNKKVTIIGLGSGGSQIAIEFAKAGVGKYSLYDFDKLELSNISRHICGIDDIGRYKTFAVKDALLNKNPNAEIETYEIDINEDIEKFRNTIKDTDLIICATDTTRSRFNVNQVSVSFNIVSLFGRAITRAAGGDILRVRPKIGPCLNCLFGQGIIGKEDEEYSQVRQIKQELPAYTSEDDIQTLIQVGLSSDILPISIMMVKLGLVELSRGEESGINSLEDDLIADFYIWANRRERIYSKWPKMEYNFNKQTILRWYGAKVNKDENCTVCGLNYNTSSKENIFR